MCNGQVSLLPLASFPLPLSSLHPTSLIRLNKCPRAGSNVKTYGIGLKNRTFKGFESRRRGVYHVACLSMKCYFKVSPPPLTYSMSSSALIGPLSDCVNVVNEKGVIERGLTIGR